MNMLFFRVLQWLPETIRHKLFDAWLWYERRRIQDKYKQQAEAEAHYKLSNRDKTWWK